MIYEVRAQAQGRVHSFGACRSYADAEHLLAQSKALVAKAGGRNDRYWIGEIDVTGLFEIPSRPTPRERYHTRVDRRSPEGAWATVRVEVLDAERIIGTYDRNYSMLQTFEPFRQGHRDFALISVDYTATAVMDLSTGQIIAAEEPSPGGFCPVGFYVPDWWDVHRGSILPGSMLWSEDYEWPCGDFGFVWGCVWGDDSSWKVQYLDLSRVQDGALQRDDRFGYVKLATNPKLEAHEFISCGKFKGEPKVEFSVQQSYDLETGRRLDEDE